MTEQVTQDQKFSYDFQHSVDQQSLDDFIEQTTNQVSHRVHRRKKQRNYSWIMIFVLMLSLIGMGTYSLIQLKEKNVEIAKLKNESQKMVAGVNETVYNRITGDNFTVVLEGKPIEDYKQASRVDTLKFFNNKRAAVTSYLAQKEADEKVLLSGIEVAVVEYDGTFNQDKFSQMFLEYLGKDKYSISEETVTIPKDISLTKIEAKEKNGITYYVAVTESNYYMIKVYNQTAEYSQFAQYSRLTEELINNLYLN